MSSDLERYALHEAGHSVAARAVGRRLGPVTIADQGAAWAGCSWSTERRWAAGVKQVDLSMPFEMWPNPVRKGIVTRAIVTAAGDVAVHLFRPHAGRVPDTVVETAVAALDLPPLTRAEAESIAATMAETDRTGQTDAEKLSELARLAHDGHVSSAATWLLYVDAVAQSVLSAWHESVERLAGLLLEEKSLSAAAVRQVLG